jgi:hypothetical protein
MGDMNEHAVRVEALVGQLLATVREPWESLRMALDKHAWMEIGDIDEEGSGAWHLMHIAEVFRIHAKAAMGEWGKEVDDWPPIVKSVAGAGRMIREDVERFSAWCIEHPERCGRVTHGEEMFFDEMIGVMLRHIVWHAAAVHYWCLWKR